MRIMMMRACWIGGICVLLLSACDQSKCAGCDPAPDSGVSADLDPVVDMNPDSK